VGFLQERWDAGCRTNKQLYAELVEVGYRGSLRPLCSGRCCDASARREVDGR
jgi:hypothetical protein